MPKPNVKELVTQMVRDIVGPGMKSAGFRRKGRVFWRDGPDVCHVVHVEMNHWGDSKQSDFSVHLGVFWHRVEELLGNPCAKKMPPLEYKCTIRIGLGRVVSTPPKPHWAVTLDSDFGAIGQDVLNDLLGQGMKWFESRSTLAGALNSERYTWKRSMQELVSADATIVLRMLNGERDQAIAELRRLVRNGHAEAAVKLAKLLKIPKREVMATAK